MAKRDQYIVVEYAGHEGERDVTSFDTRPQAERWMKKMYAADEISSMHVDICLQRGDDRTYDPMGFGR